MRVIFPETFRRRYILKAKILPGYTTKEEHFIPEYGSSFLGNATKPKKKLNFTWLF